MGLRGGVGIGKMYSMLCDPDSQQQGGKKKTATLHVSACLMLTPIQETVKVDG